MRTESVRAAAWRTWVRGLAVAGATVGGPALAQQPAKVLPAAATPAPAPTPTAEAGVRVAAYIYGGTPVTRTDLGEFLISRGGMEKIDLLVNRRIIEIEAVKRNVTVTALEVTSGFHEDLAALGVTQKQFQEVVLPRYGKSMYEWEQDVIRPRLLLGKMCGDRAKPTPEELQKAFESKYGEKREAQIVVWPKGNPKAPELTADVKATARGNPVEFEKLAAGQPDERFRAVAGRLAPIGRHIEGENPEVEKALFDLKEGEISPWVETDIASTCLRCLKIVPPDPNLTLDKVRAGIEKEVRDKKLNAEIPKLFAEIKQAAAPALTVHVPARPPAAPDAPVEPRVANPDPRVLAVVYGNIPITRDDLGEFLIARGGYEKLDQVVDKKIMDIETAKRGITVTQAEIDAAFANDLKGLGVSHDDFVKVVLPKYGRSLSEWIDSVVKPRLVLTRLCRDRVKVTDDDLKRLYENRYGEKRQAKLILWKKDEFRLAQKQWIEARKGDADFDSVARAQFDPNLASAAGMVAPIGRNTDAENPKLEQVLFTLKVGEVSELLDTPAGILCVKCVGVVPPDATVTLETVKATLEKEVYEKKLAKEIPIYFAELRQAANPNILLKGPPTSKENEDGVRAIIQQVESRTPPAPTPTPKK